MTQDQYVEKKGDPFITVSPETRSGGGKKIDHILGTK
jgi:hypothetical protein